MTHTKQFIEDAIEGGWTAFGVISGNDEMTKAHMKDLMFDPYEANPPELALLDTQAWKAVSRKRDWNQGSYEDCPACEEEMAVDWRFYMHHFIESIAMGKSIEEALAALSE